MNKDLENLLHKWDDTMEMEDVKKELLQSDNRVYFIPTPYQTVGCFSEEDGQSGYPIIDYTIDKKIMSESRLKVLDELMTLIEKHFIALNNRVLFREGKILKEQSEKASGLDEDSYERMRTLYELFKSLNCYDYVCV